MDRSCAKRGGLLLDAGLRLGEVLAALQREVAGGQVAGHLELQRWLLDDAALLRLGAARVEAAAGRRVDRGRPPAPRTAARRCRGASAPRTGAWSPTARRPCPGTSRPRGRTRAAPPRGRAR